MKWRLALFATLGIALALYLVLHVGWRDVVSSALAVGWGGFAALCLCSLAQFLLLGVAWYVLFPRTLARSLALWVRARMVRDSAAEALPLSQFGGMALGVRAAVLQGVAPPLAAASMILDVTTEMLAQIAYLAAGVAILAARVPHSGAAASLLRASLTGLALATIAGVLFIVAQRHGPRLAAWLSKSLLPAVVGRLAAPTTAALAALYRSPGRIALSTGVHFSGWVFSAVPAWLAFHLVGARVDFTAVIAIESLVYAIRSAAVLIPNALGVQEAGYVLLAPLFGVNSELALAVSLVKRARDIGLGVPVLLIWQAVEARRALRSARRPRSEEAST